MTPSAPAGNVASDPNSSLTMFGNTTLAGPVFALHKQQFIVMSRLDVNTTISALVRRNMLDLVSALLEPIPNICLERKPIIPPSALRGVQSSDATQCGDTPVGDLRHEMAPTMGADKCESLRDHDPEASCQKQLLFTRMDGFS